MQTSSFFDEEHMRKERLRALLSLSMDPYPTQTNRTHTVQAFLKAFDSLDHQTTIVLAGRVGSIRKHGGLTFFHLSEESGHIQILLKKDLMGETLYQQFHDMIDTADFLEITGHPFVTKKGEYSLQASSFRILAKTLLPLPEKWHGLTDIETCYRQRELDLLCHEEVKKRFFLRSKFISNLRVFLDEQGFLEMETPMLQPIPGGANAKPFITHHQALHHDFYLRIAPELYLKRLLVGGFEKIYEIGRCFRNEGIDYAHNPEFTMLELYWAFAEKETFILLLENMLTTVMQKVFGTVVFSSEEQKLDFTAPWQRKTFQEVVLLKTGIDINLYREISSLEQATAERQLSLDFSECIGLGEFYDQLYKKAVRPFIKEPTWIFDYPLEMKPLAKKSPDDPTKSASVQLVVQGAELINAYYHELNDPQEQEKRFIEQQTLREKGSEEAQYMDKDFLRALKHGMPPASGVGIGIDRFLAFLTHAHNLKDVILFPTLKPETLSESFSSIPLKPESFPPIPLKREEAWEAIKKLTKKQANLNHYLESEAIMRALAERLEKDVDYWGMLGLLHDIDWEQTEHDPDKHLTLAPEILKKMGFDDSFIETIVSHGYGYSCAGLQDKKRNKEIEHALACAETVTGLIYATALLRPNKLEGLDIPSLKKKIKNKKFAANVNRDIIQECEKLDLSLDEFLEISLQAMKRIAKDIGLA